MYRSRVLTPFACVGTAVGAVLFSEKRRESSIPGSVPSFVSRCSSADSDLKNSAFVFIKPHANTTASQALVSKTLKDRGLTIKAEGELTAKQIDEGRLIDQHYYAIASKATLVKPEFLPVPVDKFKAAFGIEYAEALKQGIVFNALDACTYLGLSAEGLDAAWGPAKKVKFGGGFYAGEIEPKIPGKHPKIYVFNAFFMSMRAGFVRPGTSIHYYVVDFKPSELSWADFRGKVLGPTDPKAAPAESLRGSMLKDWKSLGLDYEPTVGENCVHASASPFEGLAEKSNWLKASVEKDEFGAALIAKGVSKATIAEWSNDPQVKGKSLFDQLEDLDAPECVAKAVELANK